MSDLKVNNITNLSGSAGPVVVGIASVSTNSHMVIPSGDTRTRDPVLVTSGCTLHMDAGITSSYSGSGTQVNNIGSAGAAYTGFWEGSDSSGTGPSVIFDPVEGRGSWFLEGNGNIVSKNNYLRIGMGDTTSLDVESALSLSIWHKPLRLGGNEEGNGNAALFQNHFQGNGVISGLIFTIGGTAGLNFQTRFDNSCCQTQSGANGYVRAEWQHWTATWNGDVKRIYLNGNEVVASQTTSQTRNSMLNDIYMGVNADNAAGDLDATQTSAYRGYVSKLMIHNRALHESEIRQNYAAEKNRYEGIK